MKVLTEGGTLPRRCEGPSQGVFGLEPVSKASKATVMAHRGRTADVRLLEEAQLLEEAGHGVAEFHGAGETDKGEERGARA